MDILTSPSLHYLEFTAPSRCSKLELMAQTLCSWERGQLATPWGQGVPRHQGSVPSSVKGNPEGPTPIMP